MEREVINLDHFAFRDACNRAFGADPTDPLMPFRLFIGRPGNARALDVTGIVVHEDADRGEVVVKRFNVMGRYIGEETIAGHIERAY